MNDLWLMSVGLTCSVIFFSGMYFQYKIGSTRNRVGNFCMFWELRQKVSNNFHSQILFVTEAVRFAAS